MWADNSNTYDGLAMSAPWRVEFDEHFLRLIHHNVGEGVPRDNLHFPWFFISCYRRLWFNDRLQFSWTEERQVINYKTSFTVFHAEFHFEERHSNFQQCIMVWLALIILWGFVSEPPSRLCLEPFEILNCKFWTSVTKKCLSMFV